MKLVSWNVNGLRSVLRKNFLDFVEKEQPDVLCLQETKCSEADLEKLTIVWPEPYTVYFNAAQKKGYAGTAILSRAKPLTVTPHIGIGAHDLEGRVLTAEYQEFYVVDVYVPNAKRDLSRLEYRQRWDLDFLAFLKELEKRKPVIFCGDMNVAHQAIDLTHPKANVKNHGFTPEERRGMDSFIAAGFVDTFREFETAGGHYTWWRPFGGARQKNVGWRIDYFLISKSLRPRLRSARILREIEGSDHCPVLIDLD